MANAVLLHRKHTPFDEIYNWVAFKKYPKHVKGQGQKANFKRLCKNFRVINSKLYYIKNGRGDPDLELFVLRTKEEIEHVITTVHEKGSLEEACAIIIGHAGKDRMMKYISQRFFWRTVVKDILEYVNNCPLCKDKEPKNKFRTDTTIGKEDDIGLDLAPKTGSSFLPWTIKNVIGNSNMEVNTEQNCANSLSNTKENLRPSQKTILTAEEELQLKATILSLKEQQIELSRDTICKMAYDIVEKSGRPHPFRHNQAGREWYINFMDRHNLTIDLSKRQFTSVISTGILSGSGDVQKKMNFDSSSSQQKTSEHTISPIQRYRMPLGISVSGELIPIFREIFSKLDQVLNQTHLHEMPESIYCASELFFSPPNSNNAFATIFACANAAGWYLPPMVIFHDNIKEYPAGAPFDTFFVNSSTSFDAVLFYKWFLRFLSQIPQRPSVLIVGGNTSLITEKVTAISYIEEVKIITIPPPAASILHPLQVSVFPILNKRFSEEIARLQNQNCLTHYTFCNSFSNAWYEACSPSRIISSFQATCIYPFVNFNLQTSMPANFYKNSLMQMNNPIISNNNVIANNRNSLKKGMVDDIMEACKHFKNNIEVKRLEIIPKVDEPMLENENVQNEKENRSKNEIITEDICNSCKKYFYNDENEESCIQCFQCRKWNHCKCESIPEDNIPSIFVCSKCSQ